jgi:hypothetical protein
VVLVGVLAKIGGRTTGVGVQAGNRLLDISAVNCGGRSPPQPPNTRHSYLDPSFCFAHTRLSQPFFFQLLVCAALARLRSSWPYSDQALMPEPWRGAEACATPLLAPSDAFLQSMACPLIYPLLSFISTYQTMFHTRPLTWFLRCSLPV